MNFLLKMNLLQMNFNVKFVLKWSHDTKDGLQDEKYEE